ncbi:zinc-dependent peptidase [Candidatus Bipolaricaulota bacterium]|nr:zinc-dependent peptidase [Candidatus Bipolaricaulota bacterium]
MFIRERRRRRIMEQPLPPEWQGIIDRIPILSRLSTAERGKLEDITKVLVAEKHFEGTHGLGVTEEMRVTIAAQAALLILNRPHDYYPRLVSIILYPGQYIAPHREETPIGVVIEGEQVRAGESWSRGAVVLSWEDVRADAAGQGHPGRNVVLHEFAHQLDAENGAVDGIPALPPDRYQEWERVMSAEYARLRTAVEAGAVTFLDPYAATNPAEFFAVATERFFTDPASLLRSLPEVYEQLRRFYRQDPAGTFPAPDWVITL